MGLLGGSAALLLLELADGGVDEHVEAAERLAVGLGRRRRRRQLVGAAVDRTCLGHVQWAVGGGGARGVGRRVPRLDR